MFVPPSFLVRDLVDFSKTPSGVELRYSENNLRLGQVCAIHPTNSPQNISKNRIEYEVLVFRTDANRANTPVTLRCVVADTFGAVADSMVFTPRITTATNMGNVFKNIGATVLVLCIDSDLHQGVIVGGYPNPNIPKSSENLGHHLSFEFNGVQFNIDKDGQVAIKRRGPTNDDGTVVSGQEENGGATVLMTSDGSLSIQSGNGNKVKVDLDATNGSLNLTCTEGVVINSGPYSMVQGENLAASITALMNTISSALTKLPPDPTGAYGTVVGNIISGAMAKFKSSDFLSTKNKVD